jgi:EmrB/QacA subfamily drug resistance transporter
MDEITSRRKAVTLGVCCVSVLLVGIDMTAVNVALPAIGHDFGTGVGGLSWTIDAYTLTLAALLMFSASMADRVGRKRVFLIGLALFVAGSGLCAIAPGFGWLVAFRVLQAVGGSMLNPVAMAILSTTFPGSAARARAIGVWAGVTGLALAVGPIAGGALVTSGLGWRWIFAINIPIGLLAIVVTALVVIESKATRARRADPVGQLLVVVLLVSLTYAIIEGGRTGWTTPSVVTGFILAIVAVAGIGIYEPRRADPMLQLGFFRGVPFSGASLIAIAAFAVLSSFLFLNSLYLQQGRHFSALHAGLLITPLAAVSLVYGPVNGRLLARYGSRPCLVAAGIAYTAAGLMLTRVADTTPVWWLLIAYALLGLGNSAVGAPITHTAVAGMPRAQAGLAAGVSSAARQVGATLGVAIASVTLGADAASTGHGDGLATATHTGWWLVVGYGALIMALGFLITTRWATRTAAMAVGASADPGTVSPPAPTRAA